ncbi:hypothetical protein [Legionella drancourtii]|jgi:hypothetical protein|nr:hypothetical protein [Legionella drancourtii]
MKIIMSVLLVIASFGAFADMSGDWDAMGNPIQHPQPQPQPINPHPIQR